MDPGMEARTEKTEVDEPRAIFLEVTWSKVLFVCGLLFFALALLVGTLILAVHVGHSLRVGDSKSAASVEATVPVDIRPEINGLRAALDSQKLLVQEQKREFSKLKSELSALPRAMNEKINAAKKEMISETRSMVSELVRNIRTVELEGLKGIEKTVGQVVETKLASLQLEKAAGPDQSKLVLREFKSLREQLDNLKVRFVEMTVIWNLAERHGSKASKAVATSLPPLTPNQKVDKLSDYAMTFVANYERTKPKSRKRWNDRWETSVDERKSTNQAANERLLRVMVKLKDSKKDEVQQDDVYEACKLILAYRQPGMQFPSAFVSVVKDEDPKTYTGLVEFIEGAIRNIK